MLQNLEFNLLAKIGADTTERGKAFANFLSDVGKFCQFWRQRPSTCRQKAVLQQEAKLTAGTEAAPRIHGPRRGVRHRRGSSLYSSGVGIRVQVTQIVEDPFLVVSTAIRRRILQRHPHCSAFCEIYNTDTLLHRSKPRVCSVSYYYIRSICKTLLMFNQHLSFVFEMFSIVHTTLPEK